MPGGYIDHQWFAELFEKNLGALEIARAQPNPSLCFVARPRNFLVGVWPVFESTLVPGLRNLFGRCGLSSCRSDLPERANRSDRRESTLTLFLRSPVYRVVLAYIVP